MSRRSIFLLAAAVVLLYFSIIIFMLSPLHGSRGTYGSNYMSYNHLSLRQVPVVNWCKELQWRSPHTPNVTALVSYPGSGNTWLRYLLQQATGKIFYYLHNWPNKKKSQMKLGSPHCEARWWLVEPNDHRIVADNWQLKHMTFGSEMSGQYCRR